MIYGVLLAIVVVFVLNTNVVYEHKGKKNTPTMGGIIFIIPPLITILVLLLLE